MRDTIETNRLTLRPFSAADAARVATLVGDWDVASMCARVPHPYGIDDAHARFARMPASREARREFTFAVTLARDGIVGAMGLARAEDDTDFELGYWFGKPFWGQGYATEAGAAVLAHAMEDLGRNRFLAAHMVENARSGAVLTKLGFGYTGEVRPALCLARGEDVQTRRMTRPPTREETHD